MQFQNRVIPWGWGRVRQNKTKKPRKFQAIPLSGIFSKQNKT